MFTNHNTPNINNSFDDMITNRTNDSCHWKTAHSMTT